MVCHGKLLKFHFNIWCIFFALYLYSYVSKWKRGEEDEMKKPLHPEEKKLQANKFPFFKRWIFPIKLGNWKACVTSHSESYQIYPAHAQSILINATCNGRELWNILPCPPLPTVDLKQKDSAIESWKQPSRNWALPVLALYHEVLGHSSTIPVSIAILNFRRLPLQVHQPHHFLGPDYTFISLLYCFYTGNHRKTCLMHEWHHDSYRSCIKERSVAKSNKKTTLMWPKANTALRQPDVLLANSLNPPNRPNPPPPPPQEEKVVRG